jgi:hypothetical protein
LDKYPDNQVFLVIRAQDRKVPVDRIELPFRLYFKKSRVGRVFERYVSAADGTLSDPEWYLLGGSIVRADILGGLTNNDIKSFEAKGIRTRDPKELFLVLGSDGKWHTSFEGPQIYFVREDSHAKSEHIINPD